MSLSVDGVWKAGVWANTVWADGVWSEGGQTPTHHGKGDNGGRKSIFKPTGLVEKSKKQKKQAEVIEGVIEEVIEQEVVVQKLSDSKKVVEKEISAMSTLEIDFEISALMQKHRTYEEESMLLILIAATQ